MSELLKINVNAHTEKKNSLTYLSWAWAWAEVLAIDPQATWDAVEFDGAPVKFLPDSSAMVKTIVTIKGHAKSCWLPVMDHRNKAIKNPDAFAINTAIVRCLTKTISMHGLGLYIYAGEDLPDDGGASEAKSAPKHNPLPDVNIAPDRLAIINDVAQAMRDKFAKDDVLGAYEEYTGITDGEEKMALWAELKPDSKLRSAIKAYNESLKAAK